MSKWLVRIQQWTGASKQEVIIVGTLVALTMAVALHQYWQATRSDSVLQQWLHQLDSLAQLTEQMDSLAVLSEERSASDGQEHLRAHAQSKRKLPPTQPIDINRASRHQLMQIPGIGEVMADRIIATRSEKPFTSVEDLRRVPGIGKKKLEQLRPYVRVGRQ